MSTTNITFHGIRRDVRHNGHSYAYTQVRVHGNARGVHDLPLRLDVVNHSPNGFDWGYAGSGPAQLALAMLLELGIEPYRATLWHQDVKVALVVGLDHDEWWLPGDQVLAAMFAAEGRHPEKLAQW